MSYPGQTTFWGRAVSAAHPTLEEDLEVEVAVVGAGIAGISVAWELMRSGHHVAVLDRDRVGAGVSGHSTGKVSALQGLRYSGLEHRLGARVAASYAASQLLAMRELGAIVEHVKAECHLVRQPAVLFAEDDDALERLIGEVKAARRAGIDLSLTLETGLPFPTTGAAAVEDQIALDPLAYVRAVAADLVGGGGRVFEHTGVTFLDEGKPHVITTWNGRVVRAHHVVVATQFPIFDRALLFHRLHPRREFLLLANDSDLEPLPAMYISAGDDVRSLRTACLDQQDRLIVTGAPFRPGGDAAPRRLVDLRSWADERLGRPRWRGSWAAQDYDTPDGLPFIGPLHRFGTNLWVATGFGGWGLSNGVLAGILIRDLIEGRESAYASLFHPRRLAPLLEARSLVRGSTRMVGGLIGDRVRSRLDNVGTVADLDPGEAAYLRDAGTWAAYRDEDGHAHVVSAVCTHMGCLVTFNRAETTWECPCHGSRFSVDGEVLQGPATVPLARQGTFLDMGGLRKDQSG
jgi:glycine/D-amino acid oxidase-like deaminating enzyme/nitrite reductase/ring-hydroxylating ferredoxin subunit